MTDRSRLYTNVILTIIAIFLAIIAFKPANPLLSTAHAQRTVVEQPKTAGDFYLASAETIAASMRDVAASNESIAKALGKMGEEIHFIGTKMDAMAKAQEK